MFFPPNHLIFVSPLKLILKPSSVQRQYAYKYNNDLLRVVWCAPCSFDGGFVDELRKYIDEYLLYDEHAVTHGGENMNHLRKLLGKAAKDLDRYAVVYHVLLHL